MVQRGVSLYLCSSYCVKSVAYSSGARHLCNSILYLTRLQLNVTPGGCKLSFWWDYLSADGDVESGVVQLVCVHKRVEVVRVGGRRHVVPVFAHFQVCFLSVSEA